MSKSPQNGGFQLITGGKVRDFVAARAVAAIPSGLGVFLILLVIYVKNPFISCLFGFAIVAKLINWLYYFTNIEKSHVFNRSKPKNFSKKIGVS